MYVLILINIMVITLACYNKMTFKLQSAELPNKPINLSITKDKDLWPVSIVEINGQKVYNWIRIDKNVLSDNFDPEIEFDFNVFTANIITAENKNR